jgi:hypothetical protein
VQTHQTISDFAYALWEARGRPIGSALVDWLEAELQVTSAMPAATPTENKSEEIKYRSDMANGKE